MSSFLQICGVICEYNPFHNGHQLLLRHIHSIGGAAVAVMSGNFVQRGEPALLDKRTRARCALFGGADLVLELPAVWACAGAERFAEGGIAVLNALGCADTLVYGSEHPDPDAQQALAELLRSPEFSAALQTQLATGCTFAAARTAAVRKLTDPAAAALLCSPNDTLGIEYAKAILHQRSPLRLHPIARIGAAHDSTGCVQSICSASFLRDGLRHGDFAPNRPIDGIPSETEPVLRDALTLQGGPTDMNLLTRALLARLRTMSPEETARLPDISEGLEHRLLRAARSADSLPALYGQCKTKRYTHARIRRIVLAALLGITADDQAKLPPYIRVLGLNDRGRRILRQASATSTRPIITRPAQIAALDAQARRVFALECAATDLWALTTPQIRPAGNEFTGQIVYLPDAECPDFS